MIIPMQLQHVQSVVGIHQAVLGDTLNARLGSRHLTWLYQLVLNSSLAHSWVAVDASGAVQGFITITRDLHQLERQINHAFSPGQLFAIGLFMLSHPGAVKEILDRRTFTSHLKRKYLSDFPAILTLGVSPTAQKGGIGAQLVQEAIRTLSTMKVTNLYVDTKAENTGARRFYEKIGFQPLGTIAGNALFVFPLS